MRMPFLVAAVDRELRTEGAPARGEPLVVGVSGGADSVALTDVLASLRRRHGFQLVAAHLDHGLRAGSGDDAAFCHALCASLGVPFRGGSAPVRERAAREKGGLEEAARHERYSFLRRVKDDEGAAWIAVAHTQDDQAETLLLRLLRGAGASGLAGMRHRSGDLARPLLGVSRASVLDYLRARGLAWREDPSNADPGHLRNRVRHELLPYLEQRFNPRVREALARTAALLADEADYVGKRADELVARIASPDGRALVLDRLRLAEAPLALARAAVRLAFRRTGGLAGIDREHVDRVLQVARSGAPAGRHLQFPGGREARFTHRQLRLEKRAFGATKAVSSSRTDR
jgi:tRNA(Ile)-lysidine synthase